MGYGFQAGDGLVPNTLRAEALALIALKTTGSRRTEARAFVRSMRRRRAEIEGLITRFNTLPDLEMAGVNDPTTPERNDA